MSGVKYPAEGRQFLPSDITGMQKISEHESDCPAASIAARDADVRNPVGGAPRRRLRRPSTPAFLRTISLNRESTRAELFPRLPLPPGESWMPTDESAPPFAQRRRPACVPLHPTPRTARRLRPAGHRHVPTGVPASGRGGVGPAGDAPVRPQRLVGRLQIARALERDAASFADPRAFEGQNLARFGPTTPTHVRGSRGSKSHRPSLRAAAARSGKRFYVRQDRQFMSAYSVVAIANRVSQGPSLALSLPGRASLLSAPERKAEDA